MEDLKLAAENQKVEEAGGESAEGAKPAEQKVDQKPVPIETQMLDGIKAALKPVDTEAKKVADEQKKVDEALAEQNKGKTPEELAAIKATAEAATRKKSEDEEKEKLKGKKADDFNLTDEEKKLWKQETQRRFTELRGFAKAQQLEVERLTQEHTSATKRVDGMMSLLDEHMVEPEDFSVLLNYNKMVKTGDLAGALKIVNEARSAILKQMNKEEPGVDLLDDFPDLKAKVAENEMGRDAAIEVAGSRRRSAAEERARGDRARYEQESGAVEKSRKDGLAAIQGWTDGLAKSDINFKAKEQKLLAPGKDGLSSLDRVIREYPASLWVKTLQALYEAIDIVKPAALPNKDDTPLRPSGAKPGAKVYTELTPEALRAGLGYPH